MKLSYETTGVCAKKIEIETEGDVVVDVKFVGGCPGNTLGLSKLVKGMKVADVIESLQGTRCAAKPTSCPDQLATALKSMQ